jgi:hypothetical protein
MLLTIYYLQTRTQLCLLMRNTRTDARYLLSITCKRAHNCAYYCVTRVLMHATYYL